MKLQFTGVELEAVIKHGRVSEEMIQPKQSQYRQVDTPRVHLPRGFITSDKTWENERGNDSTKAEPIQTSRYSKSPSSKGLHHQLYNMGE
jgi:hypothetical protein